MNQDTTYQPLGSVPAAPRDVIQANWGWFLALGVFWIILGSAAVVLTPAATVAVDLLMGALLAAGGIVQMVHAFRCRGWRGTALNGLIGGLSVLAGAVLLLFPRTGILSLTLVLSVFFVVAGFFRVVVALQSRDARRWGWLLASGLLGIGVGVLIWLGWPGTAIWVLGLLFGIELLFSGWSLVMIALGARSSQ